MKLKSKLLLCATSLLTVSVAATATSAYAWFTANRNATLTYNTITTVSDGGELTVSIDNSEGKKNDFAAVPSTGDGKKKGSEYVSTTSIVKTGLVSGNGQKSKFCAPKIDEVNNNAFGWEDSSKVTGAYYTFNYKFSISGNNTVALYLAPDSIPTNKADTSTIDLTTGLRYAVTSGDDSSVLLYANPRGTNATDTDYLTKTEETLSTTNIPVDNLSKKGATNTATAAEGQLFSTGFNTLTEASVTSTTTASNYYKKPSLGYLTEIVPSSGSGEVSLTFNIWLEGLYTKNSDNDNNKVDSNTSNYSFNLNLNFYVLTVSNIFAAA